MDHRGTGRFAAVQWFFWMDFCAAIGFAAVYLQGLGYSNASLGAIMAAGCLIGAVLGPVLSSQADQGKRFTADKMIPCVLLCQALTLITLIGYFRKGIVTSVAYALYLAFSIPVNSLNLKLHADALHCGVKVDYSFARGIGSLAYVVLSILLGNIVERTSVLAVPCAGLILCLCQFAALYRFLKIVPLKEARGRAEEKQGQSLPVFFRTHPRYCVLLAGTALLFFSHNISCNFMINVTRNVGGDTSTMGFINGFMAAVEIPVMLLYSRVAGRQSPRRLLVIAFVCFSLKEAAIAAAGSVAALTLAYLLQAPSYALYTSAIVLYVGQIVAYENTAKAQSLAFTMTTVGSVMANLFGGFLYDRMPVSPVLWIAFGISAVGTVVSCLGIERVKAEDRN